MLKRKHDKISDNGKGKDAKSDAKSDAKPDALTKPEQVSVFEAQIDKIQANIAVFQEQLKKLNLGLQKMDALLAQEIDATLEGFADSGPKGVLEKVLKMPSAKRSQLQENIEKIRVSILLSQRKLETATKQKVALQAEIIEDSKDARSKVVFDCFDKHLKGYIELEKGFYDELIPMVLKAWEFDKDLPVRARKCEGICPMMEDIFENILTPEYCPSLSMDTVGNRISQKTQPKKTGVVLLERPQRHENYNLLNR